MKIIQNMIIEMEVVVTKRYELTHIDSPTCTECAFYLRAGDDNFDCPPCEGGVYKEITRDF